MVRLRKTGINARINSERIFLTIISINGPFLTNASDIKALAGHEDK